MLTGAPHILCITRRTWDRTFPHYDVLPGYPKSTTARKPWFVFWPMDWYLLCPIRITHIIVSFASRPINWTIRPAQLRLIRMVQLETSFTWNSLKWELWAGKFPLKGYFVYVSWEHNLGYYLNLCLPVCSFFFFLFSFVQINAFLPYWSLKLILVYSFNLLQGEGETPAGSQFKDSLLVAVF